VRCTGLQHQVSIGVLSNTNAVTELPCATTAVSALVALVLGGLVLPSSPSHAQSRFELPSIVVTGTPIESVWPNDAMELGTIVEVSAETHVFASYERTFRTPNVDELALATANLRPQHGEHVDLEFRTVIGDAAELSGTLFKTRIQDEIFPA
jgi:hypothetical protein